MRSIADAGWSFFRWNGAEIWIAKLISEPAQEQ
jgi:hypothetical protein